jgi:hypothetical protein
MSTRLVDAAAQFLADRTTRRGFLRRAAIVGSALAAAPAAYVLRPGSAYSALITTCANCSSGSRCCGGYTEFCCAIHGVNTCPPGSVIAGWWRAEGSGYCDGGSRYYMDCNTADCGGCGCGSSGTCSDACVDCKCGCANNNCNLRKTCCVRFRYGQCNQDVACVGPIVCRVVTCVPPWEWDSSCIKSDARDDNTRFHDAACLSPSHIRKAYPAIVTGATFALRSSLTAGGPNESYDFGLAGDAPIMADWSGSGLETAAMVRGTRHGIAGDVALTWIIRQIPGPGAPDLVVRFGKAGDIPVAGDWNGNGVDTIGVVRGNRWLLRNSNAAGSADIDIRFGNAGDIPVVGDWDGDGVDTPGVVRGSKWILLNGFDPAGPKVEFDFGSATGTPIVGDWTGTGIDRPGRFTHGLWELRNTLTTGGPDTTFQFGGEGRPVVWGRVP